MKRAAALALMMGAMAAQALAHHSFAAEYDAKKPVNLTGSITKIEWTNPHAKFYVDVKDASGTVTNWELELGSPNGLMRLGWSPKTLKPGDTVSVTGFAARDGSNLANAQNVTLPDGRKVFAGAANPTTQQ